MTSFKSIKVANEGKGEYHKEEITESEEKETPGGQNRDTFEPG